MPAPVIVHYASGIDARSLLRFAEKKGVLIIDSQRLLCIARIATDLDVGKEIPLDPDLVQMLYQHEIFRNVFSSS